MSNTEGTRFATVPQIRMSSVPKVRVGIVGHAMQLIGTCTCIYVELNTCNSQIALGFASCNFLTASDS